MRHLSKLDRQYLNGFSLIELVVVLAGLGILSGLALPNYIRLLTFNNIDDAKVRLNNGAADCLQKSRINDPGTKDTIDGEILSDKGLNIIGYKIDPNANKCSYFQLVPINGDDNIRYPIGFSVSDGKLTKFGNPTSSDQASINSCESWAGVNCKQDESLKELVAWKQAITAAEEICEDDYLNWLRNGTSPFKHQRWNTNADSGCPSRPPQDGSTDYKTSNTCTPDGCNRIVYGLDGEFAGFTMDSYKRKLEEKYGRQCTEWAAQKEAEKYTNNPIDEPIKKTPECGEQEFWFLDGVNVGSQTAADVRVCEIKRESLRTSGENKRYPPLGGPGVCGEETYVCNNSLVSDSVFYSTEGCGKAPQVCGCIRGYTDTSCKEHELSEYMINKCGARPKQDPNPRVLDRDTPGKCSRTGWGRPSLGIGSWDSSDECSTWSRCMGYYQEGNLGC